MKKRIAFIVQRYGTEVNGGAEYHCRVIAERLANVYNVDVLTSCAKDYRTWSNEYSLNGESINGVNILRFPVPFPRDDKKFRSLSRKFANRKPHLKLLKLLGLLKAYRKLVPFKSTSRDCYNWAKYQGPYVPELVNYLKAHQDNYDVLIFFTYLYYPTIYGLDVNPGKSILIPTAHDEPPIYFPVFKDLFLKPKAILYNTVAEQRFVNGLFHNEQVYSDIVGVGVEENPTVNKHTVNNIIDDQTPYLIYIGRIDASKGCKVMCEYFLKYQQTSKIPVKLILVGKAFMDIPIHENIVATGFVDEGIKLSLLEQAKALVIPSFYESLSMVTLESMAHGIPVVANGNCEVLRDHIELSKGGFTFEDFSSFKIAVDSVLRSDAELSVIKENGRKYVKENYDWNVVLTKFVKAIDFITEKD